MIYPKTLQLESGSDLLNSLKTLAIKENKFGYVLSVVGNLSVAKFQCPGKEKATTIKNHLEIIALNGTISPHKCHLHISTSDEECKVWAGHLEEGTIILKSADLLIGFLEETINKNEANNNQGATTRAAHHNSADLRSMQGRHRQQVPARLRRFT